MAKTVYFTRDEAAERIGVSIRTLDNYLASGVLKSVLRPGVGLRKRRYITGKAIRDFERQRSAGAR